MGVRVLVCVCVLWQILHLLDRVQNTKSLPCSFYIYINYVVTKLGAYFDRSAPGFFFSSLVPSSLRVYELRHLHSVSFVRCT